MKCRELSADMSADAGWSAQTEYAWKLEKKAG
jgi:hypothetical protein